LASGTLPSCSNYLGPKPVRPSGTVPQPVAEAAAIRAYQDDFTVAGFASTIAAAGSKGGFLNGAKAMGVSWGNFRMCPASSHSRMK
jgi:hypothetical protein